MTDRVFGAVFDSAPRFRSGRQRDVILCRTADYLARGGGTALYCADLLERLDFDALEASGLFDMAALRRFYRDPQMLLNDLYDTMLTHLEVRIAKIAAYDAEPSGRFERAYFAIATGRTSQAPLILSGLDNELVSRLLGLFSSVRERESQKGNNCPLNRRWAQWRATGVARYDGGRVRQAQA